jgi:hypothetical protein
VSSKCFWRRGYHRISGGTRVLELAVDIWEASLGKGARSTSTSAHEVEHTHPGGWSATSAARRTAAATRVTRYGGVDLRSAASGK